MSFFLTITGAIMCAAGILPLCLAEGWSWPAGFVLVMASALLFSAGFSSKPNAFSIEQKDLLCAAERYHVECVAPMRLKCKSDSTEFCLYLSETKKTKIYYQIPLKYYNVRFSKTAKQLSFHTKGTFGYTYLSVPLSYYNADKGERLSGKRYG